MKFIKAACAMTILISVSVLPVAAGGQTCSTPPPSAYNITFDSDRTGNYEIYTMHTDGTSQTQLTNDPTYDSWWARTSPDWNTILFYRTPAGVHDSDYSQNSLWMMNADGTNLREIIAPATQFAVHGHGEWSPDGTVIVMFGGSSYANTSTWQVQEMASDGSWFAPITSTSVIHMDTSFSPDQQKVVYISCATAGCPTSSQQVYTTSSLGGGAETPLTSIATYAAPDDPYYSPDQSEIAWLEEWNTTANSGLGSWGIDTIPAAGGTDTPIVNDGSITSLPRWSAKGNWIYTHRFDFVNYRFEVYRVCKDGTHLTEITTNNADINDEYVGPEYLTGMKGKVTAPAGNLTKGHLYTLTAGAGVTLATGTASASSPYPTTLHSTTVTVRDSRGNQISAGLSHVTTTSVTFQLPSSMNSGYAIAWVTTSTGAMYSVVVDVN